MKVKFTLSAAGAIAALCADVLIANRLRNEAFARHAAAADLSDSGEPQENNLLMRTRLRGDAWMRGTSHNRWLVRSKDNVELTGYHFPAANESRICVLLVHGHGGSSEDLGEIASQYHDHGFDVLMVDGRGHGRSGGNYSALGWLEMQDCTIWIDRIIEHLGDGAVIILHGISMGANVILNAAGDGLPSEVRAVIADSAFTSIREILTYRLHKHNLPAMPILITADILNIFGERHQIFRADTRKRVARSSIPLLFIHSKADCQNPPWMSEQLYAQATSYKEIWITGNAPHGMLAVTDQDAYMNRVFGFIQRALASC
jgi:alpha-beta hydrolase superfamily lysophospholipase